ncbi:MAG: tetratricopeptide repeat protein, partial [Elusimicrobia bacterium]|nr:tetratricopeptide repeat protein [Elusimicrobiota bacterium]
MADVDEARRHFEAAASFESKGDLDGALASLRRAVAADPTFFDAHLRMGALYRRKSATSAAYQRHAFESFRAAARLATLPDDAHNEYVMMAQGAGRLEDVRADYAAKSGAAPDDEVLRRRYKAIVALTMAMMPPKIPTGWNKPSAMLRSSVLFSSLAVASAGALMIGMSFLVGRTKIPAGVISGMVKGGF